jgi:phosphoglycolate phosphatase
LIEQIELEAAENGNLIDGTRELLHELKKRGIKTGVVTRNCCAAVNQVFPDIRLYVDSVITRDHTPLVKPDPEHLRLSLKEIQVAPEFASMVGDHPMDIKIGRDVGVLTIGVLTGASSQDDLILAGADIILEKAADLIDIICEPANRFKRL